MKYNDLINELLDLLDKNQDIKRIKELKQDLITNNSLLEDIKTYHLTKDLTLKKKLYTYPNYLEYLNLQNKINLLILTIKNNLNFQNRKCHNENN